MTRQGLPGLRDWPSGRWARHWPWVIPVLGLILSFVGAAEVSEYGDRLPKQSSMALWAGAALLILLLLGVLCLVLIPVNARAARRAYQRSRGRYNKSEMAILAREQEAEAYWREAVALARSLAAGHAPRIEQPRGVILQDGEQIMADTRAEYSRYYGTDAEYMQVIGFYYGPASFVALGYSLAALRNASQRRAALAAARTQWREFQHVQVLVTTGRLLLRMADGRWMSFYYSGATAMYPEAGNWVLVMEFQDTAPLRLGGAGGLLAAVAAVWAVNGPSGVKTHPGLARLWEQARG